MGYELNRFISEVDDEFICSICTMVLENGVQVQGCDHIFCDKCIREWLDINKTCPMDRKELSKDNIKPISRSFQNLLLKLMIKCDFETCGCQSVVKLDSLQSHIDICLYNPKLKVLCKRGCGLEMSQKEYEIHNCMSSLASLVISLQKLVMEHESELKEMRKHLWISPNGLMVNNNIIECYRERPTDDYKEFSRCQFAQHKYPLNEQNSHFNIELLEIPEFTGNFLTMLAGNNLVYIGLTYCYLNQNQDNIKYKANWFSSNGRAYTGNEEFSGLKEQQKWLKKDIITCGVIFNKKDDKSSDDVLVYFKRNNELYFEQKFNINGIGLFPTIKINKPGTKLMITKC